MRGEYYFANLTPHQVVLIDQEGVPIVLPACEKPARLEEKRVRAGSVRGIEVDFVEYVGTVNLPEPKDGVLYVVSGMVRRANPTRCDLFSPDPGKPGRSRGGRSKSSVAGLVGNPTPF